ncbi:hypothetical protein B0A48_14190 [Cryoendolithus antarcticus]|uniref:Uncharacterized protein n=1 Tax=Cryoendolithus antarcticus TaxID=1507870 RepID=A0A1V8SLF0_9PEZI|nr:hypothetical protein B0A48_14190 [Cryoendolithus antarcticus]
MLVTPRLLAMGYLLMYETIALPTGIHLLDMKQSLEDVDDSTARERDKADKDLDDKIRTADQLELKADQAADDKKPKTDKHAEDDVRDGKKSEESAAREKQQTAERAKAEKAEARAKAARDKQVAKDSRLEQGKKIDQDASTSKQRIDDERNAQGKDQSKDAPDVKSGHGDIARPHGPAKKPPRRQLAAEQRAALTPEELHHLDAVERTGKLLDDVEELMDLMQRNEAETSRLDGRMKSIEDGLNVKRQALSDTRAPNTTGYAERITELEFNKQATVSNHNELTKQRTSLGERLQVVGSDSNAALRNTTSSLSSVLENAPAEMQILAKKLVEINTGTRQASLEEPDTIVLGSAPPEQQYVHLGIVGANVYLGRPALLPRAQPVLLDRAYDPKALAGAGPPPPPRIPTIWEPYTPPKLPPGLEYGKIERLTNLATELKPGQLIAKTGLMSAWTAQCIAAFAIQIAIAAAIEAAFNKMSDGLLAREQSRGIAQMFEAFEEGHVDLPTLFKGYARFFWKAPLKGWGVGVWNYMKYTWHWMSIVTGLNKVPELFDSFKGWIKDNTKIDEAWNKIPEFYHSAKNWVKDHTKLDEAFHWTKNWIEDHTKLDEAVGWIKDHTKLNEAWHAVKNWFKGLFGHKDKRDVISRRSEEKGNVDQREFMTALMRSSGAFFPAAPRAHSKRDLLPIV